MYPGIDPQQLEVIQQIGRLITGTITVDYKEGTILLRLESTEPNAQRFIPSMVENFSQSLAIQLPMLLGVKCEIIERNKGLPYSPTLIP